MSAATNWKPTAGCVHEDPTRAVTAIEAMGRFGAAFAAPAGGAGADGAAGDVARDRRRARPRRSVCWPRAGIASGAGSRHATAPTQAVAAAERFGFPVVMKILSPDILHKSEIGGVLLNVARCRRGARWLRPAARSRARRAAPTARIEGVLVAKQLQGGVECILGIHRDPVFGPDRDVRPGRHLRRGAEGRGVPPLPVRRRRGGADDPLDQGRAAAAGRARAARRRTSRRWPQMLARLSAFAAAAGPRLASIDLNPVFAMPEGEGAFAVDAVIEVG